MANYASGVAVDLPAGIREETDGNDLVHAPLQGLTRVHEPSSDQYTGQSLTSGSCWPIDTRWADCFGRRQG